MAEKKKKPNEIGDNWIIPFRTGHFIMRFMRSWGAHPGYRNGKQKGVYFAGWSTVLK